MYGGPLCTEDRLVARIRTIKPEFFTSEDIVSLSAFARLLYIATWCEADKRGRLQWKPKTFKMRYFPADECGIEGLCDELVKAGLVVLYGDGLAYIPAFEDHQHINPRESESTLPEPKVTRQPRVGTRHSRDSDAQGGREGKEIKEDASLTHDFLTSEGLSAEVATAWLAHRKAKKAKLTLTAWKGLKSEALNAGWSLNAAVEKAITRNWISFEATWVEKEKPAGDIFAGAR